MAPRGKGTSFGQSQSGYGGIPVFRAQPLQRGSGIGGLFKGLLRFATPLIKKGLLFAGKRALTAGANALQDVADNKSTLREAVKKHALKTILPQKVINSGTRKRKSNTPVRQAKRKVRRAANTAKLIAPSFPSS